MRDERFKYEFGACIVGAVILFIATVYFCIRIFKTYGLVSTDDTEFQIVITAVCGLLSGLLGFNSFRLVVLERKRKETLKYRRYYDYKE